MDRKLLLWMCALCWILSANLPTSEGLMCFTCWKFTCDEESGSCDEMRRVPELNNKSMELSRNWRNSPKCPEDKSDLRWNKKYIRNCTGEENSCGSYFIRITAAVSKSSRQKTPFPILVTPNYYYSTIVALGCVKDDTKIIPSKSNETLVLATKNTSLDQSHSHSHDNPAVLNSETKEKKNDVSITVTSSTSTLPPLVVTFQNLTHDQDQGQSRDQSLLAGSGNQNQNQNQFGQIPAGDHNLNQNSTVLGQNPQSGQAQNPTPDQNTENLHLGHSHSHIEGQNENLPAGQIHHTEIQMGEKTELTQLQTQNPSGTLNPSENTTPNPAQNSNSDQRVPGIIANAPTAISQENGNATSIPNQNQNLTPQDSANLPVLSTSTPTLTPALTPIPTIFADQNSGLKIEQILTPHQILSTNEKTSDPANFNEIHQNDAVQGQQNGQANPNQNLANPSNPHPHPTPTPNETVQAFMQHVPSGVFLTKAEIPETSTTTTLAPGQQPVTPSPSNNNQQVSTNTPTIEQNQSQNHETLSIQQNQDQSQSPIQIPTLFTKTEINHLLPPFTKQEPLNPVASNTAILSETSTPPSSTTTPLPPGITGLGHTHANENQLNPTIYATTNAPLVNNNAQEITTSSGNHEKTSSTPAPLNSVALLAESLTSTESPVPIQGQIPVALSPLNIPSTPENSSPNPLDHKTVHNQDHNAPLTITDIDLNPNKGLVPESSSLDLISPIPNYQTRNYHYLDPLGFVEDVHNINSNEDEHEHDHEDEYQNDGTGTDTEDQNPVEICQESFSYAWNNTQFASFERVNITADFYVCDKCTENLCNSQYPMGPEVQKEVTGNDEEIMDEPDRKNNHQKDLEGIGFIGDKRPKPISVSTTTPKSSASASNFRVKFSYSFLSFVAISYYFIFCF